MPLSVQTRLMVHTAEMLALPHLVCRRRDCRRRNACHWHFSGNGEPCCLRNLTGYSTHPAPHVPGSGP